MKNKGIKEYFGHNLRKKRLECAFKVNRKKEYYKKNNQEIALK